MVKRTQSIIIFALLVALVGVVALKINTAPLAAAPGQAASSGPSMVIEKSHVLKLDATSVVMIMGSGFQPDQEIRLVISQADGSLSDIGSQLNPADVLKTNQFGVWGTQWVVGAFAVKALAKAEVYVLQACDTSYNVLATVPFGYYDANEKDYKKWPTWAQAIVPPPPTPTPASAK